MENAILDLYSNVIKALVDLEKPRRLFLDFAKAIWLIMIYYQVILNIIKLEAQHFAG